MKVSELIEVLNRVPNKDAEVFIHHWLLATKSDKVIVSQTKATQVLQPLNGSNDKIVIESDQYEENI